MAAVREIHVGQEPVARDPYRQFVLDVGNFLDGPGEDQQFAEAVYADVSGARERRRFRTRRQVWRHWIQIWRGRVRRGGDNVIIVDGPRWIGKSTLAASIAQELDPEFTNDQEIFSAEEYLGRMKKYRRRPLVYDEGGYGLLGREASSQENRELVKAVAAGRALGISSIICVFDIWKIDSAFRSGLAEFYLPIRHQGQTLVHEKRRQVDYKRPKEALNFYPAREWNPLRWASLDRTPFWKIYQREKIRRILEHAEEGRVALETNRAAAASRAAYFGVVPEGKKLDPGGAPSVRPSRPEAPRSGPVPCPRCGKPITRYNLSRHLREAHP